MPKCDFNKLPSCFSVNFAKCLRTPFFYRTPPVAGSDASGQVKILHNYQLSTVKNLSKLKKHKKQGK